ncbi:c-type cytochrome [Paracoccus cavernae]|uniref:c-type cytochrome n=1 Tax=Paracoccus cavernae TaxID=1571207 RepID=UPI0035F42B74
MKIGKIILGVVGLGVVGGAGVLGFALWPTSTREITLEVDLDDPAALERGRYIATASDCVACHTAPEGTPFAGGLPIASPVGTMYSTNITPDKATGIGNFSLNDFDRAVRHGIAPNGTSLYPAMTYPSYAIMSDQDIADMYVYFMKGIAPVDQANKAADIAFPMSMRWPVAIWRKVFGPGEVTFDAAAYGDPEIARGAYLVQGAGHCGACHTPRSETTMAEVALNEQSDLFLAGNGGAAPSLRGDADGLALWSKEDIAETLKTARNPHAAVLPGGMSEVVLHSTQHMTDEDLLAMGAYLKSLGASSANPSTSFAANETTANAFLDGSITGRGAEIYMDSCAACHMTNGQGAKDAFPRLAGNASLLVPEPTPAIRAVLAGAAAPSVPTRPAPIGMPGFAWRYSDAEIADLMTFMRSSWGNNAPAITTAEVKAVRDSLAAREAPGNEVAGVYDPRRAAEITEETAEAPAAAQ